VGILTYPDMRTASGRQAAFLERLCTGTLLGDGAMGTMLDAAMRAAGTDGAHGGAYVVPEELNEVAPEQVLGVHRAYVAAGAQVLETNSFGGNEIKLRLAGIAQGWDLNVRAARLAREAAARGHGPVWVAGSIGPTGQFLAPLGDLSFEEAREAFGDQAAALAAGGADFLLIETMTDLEEARAALLGARETTSLPVLITMTFETHGRTMMGVTPETAIQTLADAGAMAMGANCGQGPATMLPIIQRMHAARPEVPLVAQANAGQPQVENGVVRYDVGASEYAGFACDFVASGVGLLGSCCGSTPDYTRAIGGVLLGGSVRRGDQGLP
jgi:5-methyltetrahydrofolate--homocysteine methyltransferase